VHVLVNGMWITGALCFLQNGALSIGSLPPGGESRVVGHWVPNSRRRVPLIFYGLRSFRKIEFPGSLTVALS